MSKKRPVEEEPLRYKAIPIESEGSIGQFVILNRSLKDVIIELKSINENENGYNIEIDYKNDIPENVSREELIYEINLLVGDFLKHLKSFMQKENDTE